jgi:hypothetical protein
MHAHLEATFMTLSALSSANGFIDTTPVMNFFCSRRSTVNLIDQDQRMTDRAYRDNQLDSRVCALHARMQRTSST